MKNLLVASLLLLLASTGAHGYVIKPKGVAVVGKSDAKTRLWQPDRATEMGQGRVAVRLMTSEDECRDRKDCTYTVAWSADEGANWKVESDVTDFCGTAGVKINNVLYCTKLDSPVTASDATEDGTVLAYAQVGFNVELAGIIRSARFDRQEIEAGARGGVATFAKPPTEDALPQKVSALGDQVATFEDKSLHFRNVELVLSNGTAVHALYQSYDGIKWTFVSYVPIAFGLESSLMRFGETKLYIIAGIRGNYTQAESIYLGLKWEKIAAASFATSMYSYVSPFRTSIYTGLKGQPGIYAAAQGSKKGSEKPVNIGDLHNRMVKKAETTQDVSWAPAGVVNFTKEYMETSLFECTAKPYNIDGESGCESSSVTVVASPSNGTVLVFYDQLTKGYGVGGSQVNVMRLGLNETKEEKEYEEKLASQAKKAKEEEERAEQRKKAEKEAEKRRRQERREKKRQDKERRQKFLDRDAPNVARAVTEAELDGEMVTIRDVDPLWVDLEKDMF